MVFNPMPDDTALNSRKHFEQAITKYQRGDLVGALASYDEAMRASPQFMEHYSYDDLKQLAEVLGSLLFTTIAQAIQQRNQLANFRESQRQFLTNIAHELRTPLGVINMFSARLLHDIDHSLSEQQREDITSIAESSKYLKSLINDILDLDKIAAGTIECSRSFFSISAAIQSVMTSATHWIVGKPIQLAHSVEADLPDAWADDLRIRQALLHLVSNAIKFTDTGTISISAFRTVQDNLVMVQVSVADTGIGIPPEQHQPIFELFHRGDEQTVRRYEGIGLGLTLARKIIELQGGRLWLDAVPAGFSTMFSFTIPTIRSD